MDKKSFVFIEKQIRKKTFGILTTLNQDGTPHTTGILYAVSAPPSQFSLYFLTSKKYKKVRNIKKNPQVSFIIPFPHYCLRFLPSGTVTFYGKAKLIPLDTPEISELFQSKRILRLISMEVKQGTNESLTFLKMTPNPKVLCFGVGISAMKLRKNHAKGAYSVIIPNGRLEKEYL